MLSQTASTGEKTVRHPSCGKQYLSEKNTAQSNSGVGGMKSLPRLAIGTVQQRNRFLKEATHLRVALLKT